MAPLLLLACAIGLEVAATLTLKAAARSEASLLPFAVALAGYGLAFALLARSLVHLPVGVAYAVWAGVGTATVAALGGALFGESLGATGWVGVGLVASGVALLGLAAAH